MSKYQIIGPGYLGRSSNVNASRCVNLYPEVNSQDSKSVVSLVGTPGSTLFVDTLLNSSRGAHFFNNLIYFVASNKLYSVDAAKNLFPIMDSGTGTQVTLATASGRVVMANNGLAPTGGNQLAFVDGINVYVVDVVTSLLSSQAFASKTVCFIGGYFMVDAGGGKWRVSGLYDGTSWSGLDISTADSSPDTLQAVVNNHNEAWLIGDYTSEVWIQSGTGTPPFARMGVIDYGTEAPYSVAVGNNTITWLVSQRNGDGGEFAFIGTAQGYGVVPISTQAVNYDISQYSIISDAFAFCYTENGHEFYQITFPTENHTWVYDFTTQMWHERSLYTGSPYAIGRHIANCYVHAWGKHYIGDFQSGKLYEMSEKYLTDNDLPIASLRVATPLEDGLNSGNVFISSLQMDMETGVGDVQNIINQNQIISYSGFAQLEHVAVVDKYAWVTSDYGAVFKIDLTTNQVVKTIDISEYTTNPHGVCSGFGSLWISNGSGVSVPNSITRIDLITETVTTVIQASLGPNYGVICGTNYVWTVDQDLNLAIKIDPVTNLVVENFPVDLDPEEVIFCFGSVWVANYNGGTVTRINEITGASVTITVENGPEGLVFNDKFLWVANSLSGTVSKIDPATNTVVATITVGSNAIGLAYSNGIVAAGCFDKVYFIDAGTNAIIDTRPILPSSAFMSNYMDYFIVVNYNNTVIKVFLNNQPNIPVALLSWSVDGGHTWSSDHASSLGALGAYKTRSIWRRLGASRNRTFRIAISASIKKILIGAYMTTEAEI
jgi:YVTN family beta-propeller protein